MAEELQRMFNPVELKEALEPQNISWYFIPKCAPWYGGFWKHIIGITKSSEEDTGKNICQFETARKGDHRDKSHV